VQVIVGNDGGGTIFDALEVAEVASPAAMTRPVHAAGGGGGRTRRGVRVEYDAPAPRSNSIPHVGPVGRQLIEVALAR
jgi:2-succinyl-5-enolpyruvyl-6-hydroxy-3-cyclohexene-1-carboxylate synthase